MENIDNHNSGWRRLDATLDDNIYPLYIRNLRKLITDKFGGLRYFSTNEQKFKIYNVRLGVTKHIKGTGKENKKDNLIVAYDLKAKHYRSFNVAEIAYVKYKNKFYTQDDIVRLA